MVFSATLRVSLSLGGPWIFLWVVATVVRENSAAEHSRVKAKGLMHEGGWLGLEGRSLMGGQHKVGRGFWHCWL